MNRRFHMDLMRLLHGELPEERARELRSRLAADPALAAVYRQMEAAWSGLELPPAAAPPPGFAGRVAARAREAGRDPISWALAPGWVRATAAAALVAGLAAGVGLGGAWSGPEPEGAAETAVLAGTGPEASAAGDADLADDTPGSLAESYWSSLDTLGGAGETGAGEALP